MDNSVKTEPILRVENLKLHYPVRQGVLGQSATCVKAVDDISFTVGRGETFGLVGESGCGKTTAGKTIIRILEPTGGAVYYNGRDIAHLPGGKLKQYRRELQLIFQDPYNSLDPRQSVYTILEDAVKADGKRHSGRQVVERVEELLGLVGLLSEMGMRYPHELSGGQRQRLGIARALACEPSLIVCDEPVSALDVSIQAQIINLFEELQRKLGLTYIFVAHDLAVVRHIADRVGIMYLGHLVEVLAADDLYENSLHPYTRALLSAVPTTNYDEERKRERVVLEGEVPSPINAPTGCPFHPRCPLVTEACKGEMPLLAERGGEHQVACFNA